MKQDPRRVTRSGWFTASLREARTILAQSTFDLVVLNLMLLAGSGLLPSLGYGGRTLPVVVFSATDADPAVADDVAAVRTKSRASLGTLADTVRPVLLPSQATIDAEAA